MYTVVTLSVLHHPGFHTLQDLTSHASGLNLINHTVKYYLRQLEQRRRCEFHVFEFLFIIHI